MATIDGQAVSESELFAQLQSEECDRLRKRVMQLEAENKRLRGALHEAGDRLNAFISYLEEDNYAICVATIRRVGAALTPADKPQAPEDK